MTQLRPMVQRRSQRGVAALAVSLILLFGITLVAFFTQRSMIFEQRSSANQYRATKAFEMADAGLEWAVARLNEDTLMSGSLFCTTEAAKFSVRYLPFNNASTALITGFNVNTAGFPGCTIGSSGAATCGCPANGNPSFTTTASLDAQPRFLIKLETVTTDSYAVRIVSYGCTNAGTACGSSSGTPDAVAVVSSIYKMKPAIATTPGAGLVAGTSTVTGGNLNVINLDPTSNGITIDTGSTVTFGSGTNVTTQPGTPPRASVLDNDTALSALTQSDTSGDNFFKSFFGQTMAQYQADGRTWLITSGSCGSNARCTQCSGANACGTAVSAAYNDPTAARQFWSDTDVAWLTSNLPTIGTLGASGSGEPIVFATSANVELKGNITAYGLFYTATATANTDWEYAGSGTAKVFGAFISRGNFDRASGTLDLIYDANLFGEGGTRGTMVRVPGTWRDRSIDYTTSN